MRPWRRARGDVDAWLRSPCESCQPVSPTICSGRQACGPGAVPSPSSSQTATASARARSDDGSGWPRRRLRGQRAGQDVVLVELRHPGHAATEAFGAERVGRSEPEAGRPIRPLRPPGPEEGRRVSACLPVR